MDDLTDEERQTVIDLIEEAIRESHFPLSPRAERLCDQEQAPWRPNAQEEAVASSPTPRRRKARLR